MIERKHNGHTYWVFYDSSTWRETGAPILPEAIEKEWKLEDYDNFIQEVTGQVRQEMAESYERKRVKRNT